MLGANEQSVSGYHDPNYFPDGGTCAWLALFARFLVAHAGRVLRRALTRPATEELLPNASSFRIDCINSVQTYVFYEGFLSGQLVDKG